MSIKCQSYRLPAASHRSMRSQEPATCIFTKYSCHHASDWASGVTLLSLVMLLYSSRSLVKDHASLCTLDSDGRHGAAMGRVTWPPVPALVTGNTFSDQNPQPDSPVFSDKWWLHSATHYIYMSTCQRLVLDLDPFFLLVKIVTFQYIYHPLFHGFTPILTLTLRLYS